MSHNPLNIPYDKPDFINDTLVKWWCLDTNGRDPQDGVPFLTDMDGKRAYVIIKDNEVVYETSNLEFLYSKLDELMLIRTKT